MGLLRFLGALGLGWTLFRLYQAMDVYQQPTTLLLSASPQGSKTWLEWGIGELQNLALIYVIVLGLTVLTRLMRALWLDVVLQWLFWPFNALLRTDSKTTNFNVIAMIAGISYGSALMFQELKQHRFSYRDILVTMTFMGLAHGLIEETLLMIALGANWTGVLLGRVLLGCLSALVMSMLSQSRPAILNNRWIMSSKAINTVRTTSHIPSE
jgi:hypothetical protein